MPNPPATSPLSVAFRGVGWDLPAPLRRLEAPSRLLVAPAGDATALQGVLEALDAVAATGDPSLLAAGWLTYEAGVVLEGSGQLLWGSDPQPLAVFGVFDTTGDRNGTRPDPDASVLSSLTAPPEGTDLDRDGFFRGVEAIRDGIARGDVYQVNLTRRLVRPFDAAPSRLARALFADNPVPHAACLATPHGAVVSNSPELFLDVDLAARRASSAPIKGTVARGDRSRDDDARRVLLGSEKDAAEHVMIVDLVRNDLGKVAVPGGVRVPRLEEVKAFTHLLHLESTVTARLSPAARLSDVLRATLPAGSITGAPKRAALGFIRRLEAGPRGPYTGAVGYVRGNGRAVFNVAIRTAVVRGGSLAYHAGGGIVWDSLHSAEWEETETKSRELAAALDALARTGARETGAT